MEEHVYVLRTYLPVEFEDQETNEFIDYLISAYLENLQTQKFQFAFTAFHMLYMSYIYKIKWFLKLEGNSKIDDSLQDFMKQNKGSSFNTLFDLSQISEKTSLEKLLKTLSFHANDVDLCKNLVEVRNKCSHASGKIYFKRSTQIENYILEEIDNIQAVQKKIKPFLKEVFEKFLIDNWETNWLTSNIREWIQRNHLSEKDIEEILQLKPNFLKLNSDGKEIIFKKILYSSLVGELTKLLTNKGDYFLKSLNLLMKGMVEEIDIRKSPGDQVKFKSTNELIEEKILPFLTDMSNEDSLKAQKILELAVID